MKLLSQTVIWIFAAGLLVTECGCSPQASALTKLQSGDIGSLNSTEWLALAGFGTQLGIPIPTLTTEQADAVVNFLQANNIQTIEDLQQKLNSGTIEVPQEVLDLLFAG